ncbi:MAG: glycoside hydrolase [Sandaracinaceae bacterium]|nr:glycoside hydrolase [Sandaracinaceae bacterium]
MQYAGRVGRGRRRRGDRPGRRARRRNRRGQRPRRIPALVTTRRGSLLAFAEGRGALRDDGDIDLVLRRSEDLGQTWSRITVVVDAGADTAGNPAPIVLAASDRVWLLYCTNPASDDTRRSIWITSSDDDGLHWATPRELTSEVEPAGWTWYATGPGRGLELASGRLLVPCDGVDEAGVRRSHVIVSDDGGAHWRRGGSSIPDTDEATAAQLPDGRVVLDMRFEGPTRARAVAYSDDEGESFSEATFDAARPDPACEGSLLAVPEGLLFSNPATTEQVPRDHVTVRLSEDGARTWPYARELDPAPSAYTALTRLPDGTFAIAWESGDVLPYDRIRFARFDLAWLGAR